MKRPWPRAPKAFPPSNDDLRRYRVALRLLDKIKRQGEGPEEWSEFVALILHACKKAIAWEPDLSEHACELADFNEFYEDLRSALNGLEKLLKLAFRHKYKFDLIASFAESSVGLSHELLVESGVYGSLRPVLPDRHISLTRSFLLELKSELKRPRAEMRRRYLNRWNGDDGLRMQRMAGPLWFPRSAEGRKLPDVRLTGLQFELSFLLRRYTAGFPTRPIGRGEDMPAEGRPCHPIVAEFIRSSIAPGFGDDKGQAFLKLLRENRGPDGEGIVWKGWGIGGMADAPGGEINLFWE